MLYRPDDTPPFGRNGRHSLKTIYQYKPTYLEFLVVYGDDFEIDINDFVNLPHPTVVDPDLLPPKKEGGLRFYPPIKLETSVQIIIEYIKNNGKSKEINFKFSQRTIEILRLKSLGKYVAPEYVKRKGLTSEQIDIMLYTLEGTFYSTGKNDIDYLRFCRDKTVLHVVERKPVIPLDIVLRLFHKENNDIAKGEYLITTSILADYFNDKLRPPGAKLNTNSKISFSIFVPRDQIEMKFSGEIISKNEILIGQKTYIRLASPNT